MLSIQNKIKETEAIKQVKIGSRNGNLINLVEGDLKTAVNELSVDQSEDSHPDLNVEERETNNSMKFKLDFLQVRAFEVKTLSSVLRGYKELKRVNVPLELDRPN